MRKSFLLGVATLMLLVQSVRTASALTEQQWLSKLKQTEQSVGKDNDRYGEMLFAVGNFYHKGNHWNQEQAMYESAMRVFEKSPGKNGDLLRFYSDALARIYLEEGKLDKSEMLFKRALKIGAQIPGPEKAFMVPHTLGGMAQLYIAQGKFSEAEGALKQRIDMRSQFYEAGQVDLTKVDLANLYITWGKYPEAKTVMDELLSMQSPPAQVKGVVANYTAATSKASTK